MIAVIFTSQRTDVKENYLETNNELEKIAATLPGFIKTQSAREPNGFGISVSYWKTMEDAKQYKQIPTHLMAQQNGKDVWYEWYDVKVCKVERAYDFKVESKS